MIFDKIDRAKMKNRKEWEQKTNEEYSRIFTGVKNILKNKQKIEQTYVQIDHEMAMIKNILEKDPQQGQSIVQVKKKFWRRSEKSTLMGHMEDLGKRLENKFVSDTGELCSRVCHVFFNFDHKKLGEFLKFHKIDSRKLDRVERESRFEEFVRLDPKNKPSFYNVRCNTFALVQELAGEK
jgi:hypothetical protein